MCVFQSSLSSQFLLYQNLSKSLQLSGVVQTKQNNQDHIDVCNLIGNQMFLMIFYRRSLSPVLIRQPMLNYKRKCEYLKYLPPILCHLGKRCRLLLN